MEIKAEDISEEVYDIIENIPNRFNTILLSGIILIVVIFIVLGYLVNYPDVIEAKVTIKAQNSPSKIVAKTSGNLILLKSKEEVNDGDVIGYIDNSSDFKHVIKLKQLIDEITPESNVLNYNELLINDNPSLGELEQYYYGFLDSYYEYYKNKKRNKYDRKMLLIERELKQYNNLISYRKVLISSKKEELDLFYNRVQTDSIILMREGISELEFDNTRLLYIKASNEDNQLRLNIISDSISVNKLISELENLRIEKKEISEKLRIAMITSYRLLITKIKDWEEKYVFRTNVNGRLEYLDHFENGQFIQAGAPLFSVLPHENTYLGYAYMSSQGAGKVIKGQRARIKLDGYPYQEFGILEGQVSEVSLVATQEKYLTKIKLNNGLNSSFDKPLNFSAEMSGVAEIITQKKRFIQRLYSKLKYLFTE